MNAPQAFALALLHHQAGRLGDAEVLYRQILSDQPHHAGALQHLGVIAHQMGRGDVAIELICGALILEPCNPDARLNLGVVLAAQGRRDEAITEFRRALELQPDAVEAHLNLGAALAEQGRLVEAIDQYRRVVHLRPDFALAYYNLGNALRDQGQFGDAVAAYRQARKLSPDSPEVYNNLGIALAQQGQFDEAIVAYRGALRLKPDYAEAHSNLGEALEKLDRVREAIEAFRQAVQLKPEYLEAHLLLGQALRKQGQGEAAIAAGRRAIEIQSESARAHNHLGIALAEKGQLDEAIRHYSRALQLQPDYALALNNLANAFLARGHIEEAVAAYRRALDTAPECTDGHINLAMALARKGPIDEAHAAHRQALELDPNQAMLHSNVVYMLHFLPDQDDRTIAEEHRRWNRQFSDPLRPLIRPHDNDRDPERRLRIGYVSPDFHTHSVSYFFVPLLEAHDRTAFEIYAYASVGRPDEITDRIQKSADVWRDVRRLTDAELAEAVRADRIDILVDLSMHTADNRLLAFARRPAPVQVSWLGYPGSTGLETIDYRISDHYLEREDEKSEMADERQEEALCLPDSWCCFAPLVDYPAVSKLPAAERKYATFGSLNQIAKINDELLGGWARLLAAIPGSRLLMICPEGEARDRVHTLFARHGIGSERLELMAPRPWGEFTQLFQRIDIALDSFPCNGMTTTCHTLWMGVPVITRTGTTAVSRAGRSLLHTLGLPEWVARSEEEFVHIAAEWANNLPRLAELRRSMRARMASSPLMDAPRFAHHIETAYRTIWQRWCAGNSPRR